MANFIGGDILEIVVQHTIGEFRFQAKSNESFTLDPGGVRTNDDANQVTGSGDMIQQKNRVRWSFEGPIAVDPISSNEFDNLSKLAAHPELGTWTISHISGTIYKGRGTVVGDLAVDTNAAQMTLKVSGSGKLEKI
tara:strand:+ start:830 stop:1237 length:408 start_codon:yes stop_codon:yes gene_type:complete